MISDDNWRAPSGGQDHWASKNAWALLE